MADYNGYMDTAPKKKRERKLIRTINRDTCLCEVYERGGKSLFQLRSRLKFADEYPVEAVEDLLFVLNELVDFRIERDGKHRETAENA